MDHIKSKDTKMSGSMENFKKHQAAVTARAIIESDRSFTGVNRQYIGKGNKKGGARSPNASNKGSQKLIGSSPKLIMEGIPGN